MGDAHYSAGDEEMEKLVMLRMNNDLMVFMREHYPLVAEEQFNDFRTVITYMIGREQQ